MLPSPDLDAYGLINPPAVVHAFDGDALTQEQTRAAEEDLDLNRWAEQTAEQVRQLVTDAAAGKLQDLDAAIQGLETLEDELRAPRTQLLAFLEDVENIRARALRMRPILRGSLLANAKRFETSINKLLTPISSVLKTYRDSRWQLMVVQGQRQEPSENPIFEDADALVAFLKA